MPSWYTDLTANTTPTANVVVPEIPINPFVPEEKPAVEPVVEEPAPEPVETEEPAVEPDLEPVEPVDEPFFPPAEKHPDNPYVVHPKDIDNSSIGIEYDRDDAQSPLLVGIASVIGAVVSGEAYFKSDKEKK